MRMSFSPIATLVAASFALAAISLTGCQNSFKMPSTPSWLSWGKKKPSSSFASTKPDTNLPSPSATASPSQPQTYAQNRGNGAAFGAQPGASYYSNASHGTAPTNPNYATGRASSDRGFYSPDYAKGGARQNVSGGYDIPPVSYAGNPRSPGNGSNYNSYGPNGFAPSSRTPAAGQSWTSNDQGSQFGSAPNSRITDSRITDYDYSRTATRNTASDYSSYGTQGASSDYRRDSTAYGGATSSYSSPKNVPPYSGGSSPGAGSTPATSVPAVASGEYRPGSTSRNTQYGDSQNINVANLRDIQRASYGTESGAGGTGSVTDRSQAAPATYGSQGSRTATPNTYPRTSPSIYR